VSGGFVLDCISNCNVRILKEIPSDLLSQRNFVIYVILLRKSTVMQNHMTELLGEHCPVGK